MKKLLSIVLILLMFMANCSFAEPSSAWLREGIDDLKNTGLFPQSLFGDYTGAITRQDLAYIAVPLYELIKGESIVIDERLKFSDTQDAFVLKGVSAGIISGVGEGRFNPKGKLTRAELLNLMVKALSLAETSAAKASTVGYKVSLLSGLGDKYTLNKSSATREQGLLMARNAFFSGYSSNYRVVDALVLRSDVIVNGERISASSAAYPAIVYNGIPYIPTLSQYLSGLNKSFTLTQNANKVVRFNRSTNIVRPVLFAYANDYSDQRVDNYNIAHPVLHLAGVKYIPFDDALLESQKLILERDTSGNLYISSDGKSYMPSDAKKAYKPVDKADFSNGDKYSGEFKYHVRNGIGTYIFANGERYNGTFIDDAFSNNGEYYFLNRDHYLGSWFQNKMHGTGTYTFAHGDVYKGQWVDNRREGYGEYIFANGFTIKGTWKDNYFVLPLAKPLFFTIGSSMNEVVAVQGLNYRMDYTSNSLVYGSATIKLDYLNRVISWSDPEGLLRTYLGYAKVEAQAFGMYASLIDVINAMGTPDELMTGEQRYLKYKNSYVFFDKAWRVTSYSNASNNLNVKEK